MNPIRDLRKLLTSLEPSLDAEEYGFCSVPAAIEPPADLDPFATVREPEGLTLVVSAESARRAGLAFEGPFRLISLTVYSSLEAVGLTAAVARALADAGISANVIAGYHHDHIFVPADRAQDAMAALERLAAGRS